MELNEARALLQVSGFFFDADDEVPPWTLNLNDAFYWAAADCETVPEECLVEVARLFRRYGWCGILTWVLDRRKIERVEFEDINRFVKFVRQEERVLKDVPESNKRAYYQTAYTIE